MPTGAAIKMVRILIFKPNWAYTTRQNQDEIRPYLVEVRILAPLERLGEAAVQRLAHHQRDLPLGRDGELGEERPHDELAGLDVRLDVDRARKPRPFLGGAPGQHLS